MNTAVLTECDLPAGPRLNVRTECGLVNNACLIGPLSSKHTWQREGPAKPWPAHMNVHYCWSQMLFENLAFLISMELISSEPGSFLAAPL